MGLMYRLEVLKTYSEGFLSKIVINKSYEKLEKLSSVDVVVVGLDLSGLVAGWILSSTYKILLLPAYSNNQLLPPFYPMMYGIVQEGEALEIVRELGATVYEAKIPGETGFEIVDGIYLVDPVELYVKLLNALIERNVYIIIGYKVDDLITEGNGVNAIVTGLVIVPNASPDSPYVKLPMYIDSKVVVDNTGRDAQLVRILAKRQPQLKIGVEGSATTEAWRIEEELLDIIEKYALVRPGLFVTGYSLIETYNLPKADLILGTHMCIGKKIAHIIKNYIEKTGEKQFS
ncbi:MAG: hypothetical protein QXM54_02345 [Desulfurococcaceae archaeon]|uniref:Uncharacterized protein n=1 Tax=Staphylothermus marinus TaxID=2280 RepID=A0A7C4D8T7_STAMA